MDSFHVVHVGPHLRDHFARLRTADVVPRGWANDEYGIALLPHLFQEAFVPLLKQSLIGLS